MSVELIIFVAALVVSVLLFAWLVRVAKSTLRTAVIIAGIALLLQLLFGIGPQDLFQEVVRLLELAWEQVSGGLNQLLKP